MNLTDLETKGFVVIKGFFSTPEIELLKALHAIQKTKVSEKGFSSKRYNILFSVIPLFLKFKISELLKDISAKTNITVTTTQHHITMYDTDFGAWGWHQDLEPFLLFQDAYNSLNCWFPIIKDSSDTSGLSVVSAHKLSEMFPDLFNSKFYGKGGKSFKLHDTHTEITDGVYGDKFSLPVNLDDIGESPIIEVGDILILRHDTIHRTQPNSNDRVAVSIRCYNENGIFSLEKMLDTGGDSKQDSFEKYEIFAKIKHYLESNNKQQETLGMLFKSI